MFKSIGVIFASFLLIGCNNISPNQSIVITGMDLKSRVGNATTDNIIDRNGKSSWGPRIIKHNSTYYAFITEWDDNKAWDGPTCTIVRYTSNSLYGPYTFDADLTSVLKEQQWSSNWLHNCDIDKFGDTYYLYYVGEDGNRNYAIGVATSTDPGGTWTPYTNNPIIETREDYFDSYKISNASIYYDGSKYRMLYRGTNHSSVRRLGMAEATDPKGPWTGRGEAPNFSVDFNDKPCEDLCVWKEAGQYWAVLKTFNTLYAVPGMQACLAVSRDGSENSFVRADNVYGLDNKIRWSSTSETSSHERVEFHFVYVDENGDAKAIVNAVSDDGYKTGFSIIRPLSPLNKINNNHNKIKYSGTWNSSDQYSAFNGTLQYTTTKSAYAELTFTGTAVKLYSKKGPGGGIFEVYIDGDYESTFDSYNSSSQFQVLAYKNTSLSDGQHTIKMVCTGKKNASSSGTNLYLDFIDLNNSK